MNKCGEMDGVDKDETSFLSLVEKEVRGNTSHNTNGWLL